MLSNHLRAGLLAMLAMVACAALAPAAHATRQGVATVGGATVQATFTEQSEIEGDPTIVNEAVSLLDQATPGSGVSIALHSMSDNNEFEWAIWRARERGVWIGVVFHESSNELDWLHTQSTTAGAGPSWLKECVNGCISAHPSGAMHSKFMLFSELKRPDGTLIPHTTWVSSANMTKQTGKEPFNNSVTMFAARGLYDQMRVIWDHMFDAFETTDYFRPENGANAGWGYFHTDKDGAFNENTWGYASPEGEGQGDLWYGRLNDIQPPFEGGGPCSIRVMQTMVRDTRPRIADELVRLKNKGGDPAGCNVYVVVNKKEGTAEGTGFQIGQETREKLYCAGIPVHWARVHDKAVITTGTYAGGANRPMVMTGSHNMSKGALVENDELLVRFYNSQSLYDLFRAHFGDAYSWNGGQSVPRDVEGDASLDCN